MFDREPLLKVEATIKSLRQERARLSKISRPPRRPHTSTRTAM